MRVLTALPILLCAASLLGALVPQSPPQESPRGPEWAALEGLVGTWKGTSDGIFGAAELETTWEFVLADKFLQSRTLSESPKETHRDMGMLSFDKRRKRFVLREFYSEGHVNQYVMTPSADGRTLTFETEAVENGFTPDLLAKTTITFVGPDELSGTLALATGKGPYKECMTWRLERRVEEGD